MNVAVVLKLQLLVNVGFDGVHLCSVTSFLFNCHHLYYVLVNSSAAIHTRSVTLRFLRLECREKQIAERMYSM